MGRFANFGRFAPGHVAPIDVARSLENLKLERDAIDLYDALAGIERDERRAAAFQRIASNEGARSIST